MNLTHKYPVLQKAREITQAPNLEHLSSRKYLGFPLAEDMRKWLREQPTHQPLYLDFTGIHTLSGSVAEEVGSLVMEAVLQSSVLEHRYPIFYLDNADNADTLGLSFENRNLNALGLVATPIERTKVLIPIAELGTDRIVVLGPLSKQNEQIMIFAEQKAQQNKQLTSEQLEELEFLANVSPAARSKRLTELYSRRLLAFSENPCNYKERIFVPPWRL